MRDIEDVLDLIQERLDGTLDNRMRAKYDGTPTQIVYFDGMVKALTLLAEEIQTKRRR